MKLIRALLARNQRPIEPVIASWAGAGDDDESGAHPGAAPSAARDLAALAPGDVIAGRYRFVRPVGRGAFGTVLLVEDDDARPLLLKFLNPHLAADEETVERFAHEVRYVRRISHRNVIRLYDFLSLDGHSAISMEYFPSHTLASELSAGALPMSRALHYGCEIANGMQAAHEQGIVHRDLKPSNILINAEGELKIVDFGVAAAAGGREVKRGVGYVIGSPRYMAPEQALGQAADRRSDIYSLGCILYQMLAGEPPYPQEDPLSVLYQHVQGTVRPLREVRPALPARLARAVHKAMAVQSSARFCSMRELCEELARFAGDGDARTRRAAMPC